jgi:hypothetical protein
VSRPDGKKSLGRTRRRWEGNIKIDLREIGRDGMDWNYLAQDGDQLRALVNIVILVKLRFLYNAGKFLSGCTTGGSMRSLR